MAESREVVEARDLEIGRLRDAGVEQAKIAQMLGVNERTVRRSLKRTGRWHESKRLRALKPKQQKFVLGMAAGLSPRRAALEAGFSEGTADNARKDVLEKPGVEAALKDVVRRAIPNELLAERLREGVDAKRTEFFAHQGHVISKREVIDLGQRRQYIELAAKLGGQVKDSMEIDGHLELVIDI